MSVAAFIDFFSYSSRYSSGMKNPIEEKRMDRFGVLRTCGAKS
jgi:hypothetical protein